MKHSFGILSNIVNCSSLQKLYFVILEGFWKTLFENICLLWGNIHFTQLVKKRSLPQDEHFSFFFQKIPVNPETSGKITATIAVAASCYNLQQLRLPQLLQLAATDAGERSTVVKIAVAASCSNLQKLAVCGVAASCSNPHAAGGWSCCKLQQPARSGLLQLAATATIAVAGSCCNLQQLMPASVQ